MKKHNIPLESLTPKNKIKTKLENGELHVPAEETNIGKSRHHINVPGKYKLPFRIDMAVKVKYLHTNQVASQLTWYIGNGMVYFNGGHTSASDIIAGDEIFPDFIRYNGIPSEEFIDISVMFGSELMWVAVDGEYCFSSKKVPYMGLLHENPMLDPIRNGVDISICGGTSTKLTIKSLAITEYEDDEPDLPEELTGLPELSIFDHFVNGLPSAVHDEMHELDKFLLDDMKGAIKFRKSIKNGNLTYQSPCGFRVEVFEYGAGGSFITCWAKNPKKPDYTNAIILKIAESLPDFAEKIFTLISGCEVHDRGCNRTVIYEFMGKSKVSCSGRMNIKMDPTGFEDLKKFIIAAGEVLKA